VAAERPGIAETLGGPLGVAESALPAVAFVVAYTISGSDTKLSAGVAVAVALGFGVARLIRGGPLFNVVSGIIGVLFAAFIATKSGKAENFFLPGLLFNAGYAAAFLISIFAGWPLVGVIVGTIDGEGNSWRGNRARTRVFVWATWLWVGVFALRLLVQLPLYLAGDVVALGVARTAMGLPLFALGLWITYRLVRRPAADNPPDP
jgi:Protein of unknown function (DUF3159)